jgi:hypothetical protein
MFFGAQSAGSCGSRCGTQCDADCRYADYTAIRLPCHYRNDHLLTDITAKLPMQRESQIAQNALSLGILRSSLPSAGKK